MITYEIVGISDLGVVNVRKTTRTLDANGDVISKDYHRYCISPIDDYSAEDQLVKNVCDSVFTPQVIADYQAFLEPFNIV